MAAFGMCYRQASANISETCLSADVILTIFDNRNTLDKGDGGLTSSRVKWGIGEEQGRFTPSDHRGVLSQCSKLFSSYKTTVYNPGTQKVAITCSNASYSHSGPRLLSSFSTATQSARWPDNMVKWGSMGKFPGRGRLLGNHPLR